MKNLIIALTMICATSSFAFAKAQDDQEFIIKLGFQPQSIIAMDGKEDNLNIGISAGVEYFKYFGNIIAAGAGAIYDLPRKAKDSDRGDVSFLPMYLGLKIRTPLHGLENNYAFLSGRLGYSAFMYNDLPQIKSASGGTYYAAGVGISISQLVLEAIYSISNFSIRSAITDKSYDAKCSTIGIYAGFKFE